MPQLRKTTIWLSPGDLAIIRRLARTLGRTQSDVIREGIRRLGEDTHPKDEWESKPDWELQHIGFDVWNDRRKGVPAATTARRLGVTEDRLLVIIDLLERRLSRIPDHVYLDEE